MEARRQGRDKTRQRETERQKGTWGREQAELAADGAQVVQFALDGSREEPLHGIHGLLHAQLAVALSCEGSGHTLFFFSVRRAETKGEKERSLPLAVCSSRS